MSSPVQLSDLPVATSANNSDLMLLRKGLTDYQCAVSVIRQINIQALSPIPKGPNASDRLIISRVTGSDGGKNYYALFSQVGFVSGTKCWFYQTTAPIGWTTIDGLGDSLVAVASPKLAYSGSKGGSKAGTWQQEGASLSLLQIPNHNHFAKFGQSQSNADAQYIHGAKNTNTGPAFGVKPERNPIRGMVGGKGDNSQHDNYGGCDPHNHGKTWRPQAYVGVIGSKN